MRLQRIKWQLKKFFFSEARQICSIGVSDTPIEKVGSGAEYIDFKRRLYVKARILKADETALATN